jgi:hypothetical protein
MAKSYPLFTKYIRDPTPISEREFKRRIKEIKEEKFKKPEIVKPKGKKEKGKKEKGVFSKKLLKKPKAKLPSTDPKRFITSGMGRPSLVREGRTGYFDEEYMGEKIKWLS